MRYAACRAGWLESGYVSTSALCDDPIIPPPWMADYLSVPVTVMFAIQPPFMAFPAVIVAVAEPLTTVPVAGIVAVLVVARGDPVGAGIWRTRPVTGVPLITRADRIPISTYPLIARAWARRLFV